MPTFDRAAQWAFIRSVKLFRPYPDEVPWELFDAYPSAADDGALAELIGKAQTEPSQCYLRVAKLNELVIGVYLIRREDTQTFVLEYLVVTESQRRRGLGRWLVGHAVGIAESKGARRMLTAQPQLRRFLAAYGFTELAGNQCFEFVPE